MRKTQQAKASAARRGGLRRRVFAGLCALLLGMLCPLSIPHDDAYAATEEADIQTAGQRMEDADQDASLNSASKQMMILLTPGNAAEQTQSDQEQSDNTNENQEEKGSDETGNNNGNADEENGDSGGDGENSEPRDDNEPTEPTYDPLTIRYQSESDEKGSVSLRAAPPEETSSTALSEVIQVGNGAVGAKAEAKEGYKFDHWTKGIEIISADVEFVPTVFGELGKSTYQITEDDFKDKAQIVFTAHFLPVQQSSDDNVTSFVVNKAWQDVNVTEIKAGQLPIGSDVVITLYQETKDGETVTNEPIVSIRLDGTTDETGEGAPWTATFQNLPKYAGTDQDKKIAYKARETWSAADFKPYIREEDTYRLSGDDDFLLSDETVYNRGTTLVTFKKVDEDGRSSLNDVKFELYKLGETEEETTKITDTAHPDGLFITGDDTEAEEGTFTVALLDGIYRVVENAAPEQYNKADDVFFKVLAGKISRLINTDEYADVDNITIVNEKIKYTVTYEPGDHGTFERQIISGLVYDDETPDFEGKKTGETGYTFNGWSPAVAEKVTGDATYTAQWLSNAHTVTYTYTKEVPENAPDLPEEKIYSYGEKVEVSAMPVLEGYTFSGWTTRDVQTVDGQFTMPDKNVVLTGSWKINTHTVKYEYESDVPARAPSVPVRRVYSYGTVVTVAADKTLSGYTFSGWSTQDAQIGKDDTFSMPDTDVTIKGSWKANDDQLTYQGNGGTGTMNPTRGKVDQEVTVSGNEFTRKGYAFTGWNTRPSGLGTAYATGDAYQLTTGEDTLYAQWERESYPYTIHYYLKGTTTKVAEDYTDIAPYGSRVTVPEEEPEFLKDYEGYELTRSSSSPLATLAIGTGDNVITIYYTLPLTVTVADKTVVYSGSRQYGYTLDDRDMVTVTGLLPTDELSSKAYTSAYGTTVSDSEKFDGRFDKTQIPGYYTLTLDPGSLIIQPRAVLITITGRITEKVYNGVEYSANGYAAAADDPLYKTFYISFEGEKKASRVNVGTTMIGLTASQFANLDPNFTATFRVTDGYVTVTPRAMKITTGSASRDYNGKALTNGTAKLSGLAAADKVTLKATGSITDVGLTTNGYAIEWTKGSPDNYIITEDLGTLEVTPAKVKITTGSATKAYDGEPLTKADARISGLASGETVTLTATGTITEVGETENGYAIVWDNAKESNYIIESESLGTLKVTEAKKITTTTSVSSRSSSSRRSTTKSVTLKVIYSTSDKKNVPEPVTLQMTSGDAYYIVSPFLDGYETDTQIVQGTITKNTTVRVKYTKTKHNLEIRYMTLDGTEIAAGFSRSYGYGEAYSVESPEAEGYTVAQATVSGTMGSADLRLTVLYLPTDGENAVQIARMLSIEDYNTPLGLGDAYHQMGVCLE